MSIPVGQFTEEIQIREQMTRIVIDAGVLVNATDFMVKVKTRDYKKNLETNEESTLSDFQASLHGISKASHEYCDKVIDILMGETGSLRINPADFSTDENGNLIIPRSIVMNHFMHVMYEWIATKRGNGHG